MGRAVVTDNPFLARRTNGTVTLPSLSSSAEGSEFIRDRFDKMFGQLGTVVVSFFFCFCSGLFPFFLCTSLFLQLLLDLFTLCLRLRAQSRPLVEFLTRMKNVGLCNDPC